MVGGFREVMEKFKIVPSHYSLAPYMFVLLILLPILSII